MPKKSAAQLQREINEALAHSRTSRQGRTRQGSTRLAHSSKKMTKQRVLQDMARALAADPTDLEVVERRPYDKSFEVNLGSQSYAVVPNEDTAHKIALARVKEDLKDDPEIFNASFVARHIDQEALKKWVYKTHLQDDYVDELAARQIDDFWDLARRLDVDKAVPDNDEDGNLLPPTRTQLAAVKKAYAEDAAKNPMSYFENVSDDPVKSALKAAGIDVEAAAEDAIHTDGWQHFLAHYDGHSHTTGSGLVYWRTN